MVSKRNIGAIAPPVPTSDLSLRRVWDANCCVANKRRGKGLTLTELLVVIAILVAVTAVLAPLISPSLEGREVREAARQVNAFIQNAQQKAKELNRPIGIAIQRGPADPDGTPFGDRKDFGYQLSLVEQPPPFRGFLATDRAYVDKSSLPTGVFTVYVVAGDPAFQRIVQPNDRIRLNLRGSSYRILSVRQTNSSFALDANYPKATFALTCQAKANEQGPLIRLAVNSAVPYEVYRRPRVTSSTPLEMPVGTALVMNLSGVGMDSTTPLLAAAAGEAPNDTGIEAQSLGNVRQKYIGLTEFQRVSDVNEFFPLSPTPEDFLLLQKSPLVIMFSPDGSVDEVHRILPPLGVLGLGPKKPQDKIYLFVGKDVKTTAQNYDDKSNLWIAIDPSNGLVSTSIHQKFGNLSLANLAYSRQIAATGQSMGGQ